MGGPSPTTSKTSNEPWAGAQPYLKTGYAAAQQNILNNPTQFFPGSTVVPFSPETQAGLGATANRAYQGSPVLGAAQDYTTQLLTDPTQSPVYDAVLSSVKPNTDAAFAGAGRNATSPGYAEALGRGISRGVAPYMESAASRAPALAQADYYDINQLLGVGQARESKAGQYLSDQMARYDYAQQEPANRTQSYVAALGGLPIPMNSTTRQSGGAPDPLTFGLGTAAQLGGSYLAGK